MNFLEYLYYLGLSAKRYISLKKQKRLPFRVISIGNITVGGTGKTPATIAVAEEAQKRGFQPVILTRGYKGKAQGPCFVTKGEGPLLTVEQAGDEPFLMAERLRGVPIIKGAHRYEAGMYAIEQFKGEWQRAEGEGQEAKGEGQEAKGEGQEAEGEGQEAKGEGQEAKGEGQEAKGEGQEAEGEGQEAKGEGQEAKGEGQEAKGEKNNGETISPGPSAVRRFIFILDDGFQHWRLHRDKDVVLIDARYPFGNGRLFPMGRLREPLPALQRADVVVITRAEREDSGLIAEIRKYNPRAPIFFSHHRAVSVQSASGERKPVAWLKGKKAFCFCGLADPDSFRSTVASAGAEVTGMKAYRDHHPYRQTDMVAVVKECRASGASWILTTAKDMVKLTNLDLPENILIIEIAFTADQPFFDSVFA